METAKETQPSAESADDLFTNTPIGIVRSMQAYMRELPTLLANPKYHRCFVLYAGNERIGISDSGPDLLRECHRRGIKPGNYYLGVISEQDPDEWTGLFLH
jgi:hypothetical protein